MYFISQRTFFILILILGISFRIKSQSFARKMLNKCKVSLNEKRVLQDSTRYPTKLVFAPILSFTPITNWGIGAGAKILFKFKNSGDETRTSNFPITARYTLNNQIIIKSGYRIFFNQEKWYLTGSFAFSKFPQSYYGIGKLSRNEEEEIYSFNNYLLETLLLKKLYKKLFMGAGFRYSVINNTKVAEEGSLIQEKPLGYNGSKSAGLEMAIVWDSRDNVLNAHKGFFVEFKQGFYEAYLGGTQKFSFNQLDIRTYISPWEYRRDVIAFHLLTRFASGDVPITELSLLGGARNARGYQRGRYRDLNIIATQLEYRWQVKKGMGLVFFTEVGEVFNDFEQLNSRNLKYGLGAGIRFRILKKEDLNLRFDYGIGLGHQLQSNFYLGIAEAF